MDRKRQFGKAQSARCRWMKVVGQAHQRLGLRWPLVLLACVAVIALLALTIWGLVKTFGLGPHAKSLLGPIALTLAITGFVALFAWARQRKGIYGLEESVDGGLTPRWHIRTPILFAFLFFVLIGAYSESWVSLLFIAPLALAVAYIYRPDRLRSVRRPFSQHERTTQ